MRAGSPEERILICVARHSLDASTTEQLSLLLQGGLDWDYLLTIANHHGLIPLLYLHLSAVDRPAIPKPYMLKLKRDNEGNTKTSLFLTGELIKVIACLEEEGVRAIPFKGPTLALRAYGDVGLRQSGDLDIMVHRRDVPRIWKILITRGFTPKPELTSTQQAALLRFDCACNFDNGDGVVLDLHWAFVEPHSSLSFDVTPLWDRLEPVTIGGNQLMTLSPEDLLLVLCLHGFTHLWERLGWICDVASLVDQQKGLDWQRVLENANGLGMRRILLLGLVLAIDVLDAAVPPEIRQLASGDAVVKRLAGQIQKELFQVASSRPGLFGGIILTLNMRERRRDKLRFCFRLITTPRRFDWLAVSLPDRFFFLYYVLRPLRLAGKYGAQLLKGSPNGGTPTKADKRELS